MVCLHKPLALGVRPHTFTAMEIVHVSARTVYDAIVRGYARQRLPDPRIAVRVTQRTRCCAYYSCPPSLAQFISC